MWHHSCVFQFGEMPKIHAQCKQNHICAGQIATRFSHQIFKQKAPLDLSHCAGSVVTRCLVSLIHSFSVHRRLPHMFSSLKCEYWVLSMHPASIARYKQEKQVQLEYVLTHLICTRASSQVRVCTLAR